MSRTATSQVAIENPRWLRQMSGGSVEPAFRALPPTRDHSTMADDCLSAKYELESWTITPDETLTFGRSKTSTIALGENAKLHRRFGEITFRDGSWWLKNRGRRLPITITHDQSRTSIELTSGEETALTFSPATIAINAGAEHYRILIECSSAQATVDTTTGHEETGTFTEHADIVPLVGEQRLLAIALAEQTLRDPHAPLQVPTNKSIAHRLGWTMTAYNRKLDRMCKKYSRAGVSGLVDPGGVAGDRRRKLIEHLVGTGVLTTEDLELLECH